MSEKDSLRELVADLLSAAGTSDDSSRKSLQSFEDAGLFSIGIDEADGGSGGTVGDLVVIAEAAGAGGSVVPLVEFSMARWVLACSANAKGLGTSATAVLVDMTAEELQAGGHVIGPVACAGLVDTIVVCTTGGISVAFSTADPGVRVDASSDLARGSSDTVEISPLAEGRALQMTVATHLIDDRFALLRAAALSGAVRGAYELTREYVRSREQFGSPLVKLPAVAAGIATIRTKVLESSAAVDAALVSGESLPALAARVVCARCATDTARLAHQLHGAMGTTHEYPLHTLTTALWSWRDADRPEQAWAQQLGERIVQQGESQIWDAFAGASK